MREKEKEKRERLWERKRRWLSGQNRLRRNTAHDIAIVCVCERERENCKVCICVLRHREALPLCGVRIAKIYIAWERERDVWSHLRRSHVEQRASECRLETCSSSSGAVLSAQSSREAIFQFHLYLFYGFKRLISLRYFPHLTSLRLTFIAKVVAVSKMFLRWAKRHTSRHEDDDNWFQIKMVSSSFWCHNFLRENVQRSSSPTPSIEMSSDDKTASATDRVSSPSTQLIDLSMRKTQQVIFI